jgi:hypothetical protein
VTKINCDDLKAMVTKQGFSNHDGLRKMIRGAEHGRYTKEEVIGTMNLVSERPQRNAREEIMTRNYRAEGYAAFERWRQLCPYGKWSCADGREVLFNRYYEPLYERAADGTVTSFIRVGKVTWIEYVNQQWFFNDSDAPVSYGRGISTEKWRPALERVNAALATFGLPPMPPRPARRRS